MFKKSKMSMAVASAFSISAAGVTLPAFAQEEASDLEEVVITGSRIKRTDLTSSTPLNIMSAEDMKAAARFTVADALRNSPANQFGSFNQRSGSTAQSQATIDLLGAGSDRTLVLMDGKRVPGSPSLGGTSVNLNTIPTAMVERIEIVKDGASAIYGSDAISGAVNVILKKDYEGVTLNYGRGFTEREGGETEEMSIVFGMNHDRGNITFAFEAQSQDPIFDGDRSYTAARMEDLNGDGVITRAVETDGISNFGATIINPVTGAFEASPQCDNLTATVPGFVGVLEEASGGQSCGFAYANVSANMASVDRNSVMINADYDITDDIEIFARIMTVHNESFGRYAPPAAFFPLIPANTEHNPYDQDTFGRFRFYQLGNRANTVDDYTQDYLVGINGSISDSVEYEVYYHRNQTDNKSIGNTYLSVSGLITNLYYDTPFDSEQGLAALSATTLQEDKNIFEQWYAGISFDGGELSGGAISHYFGVETFDIRYSSTVDRQSEGGLVGGSSGNSSGATREIMAAFYEVLLPVTDNIEVNMAVRYDDYDDFGSEVSPKISASWRPIENLMLRASWGEGFRAPTLEELTQADAFSATDATDFVLCQQNGTAFGACPEEQFQDTVQSNAQLAPETSTFINFGAVWTPTDNLDIVVDYFNLEVENVIQLVEVQDLIFGELAGIPSNDPSLRIIREANGSIREVFTGTVNGPGFEITGINAAVTYALETSFGNWNVNWNTAYHLEYNDQSFFGGPLQDQAGWGLQPDLTSQITLSWMMGNHTVSWNTDYTDATFEDEVPVVQQGQTPFLQPQGDLTSFTIHNLTYSYDAGDYGRYTVAARNVFDRDPVFDSLGTYPRDHFDIYTQGHIGRVITVNAELSF